MEKDNKAWKWCSGKVRGEIFEDSFNFYSYATQTPIHASNPFGEFTDSCDIESVVKCMNKLDDAYFENIQTIQLYYSDITRWDQIYDPEFVYTLIRNPHTEKLGKTSFYISDKRIFFKYPTNKYSNN